MCMQAFVSVSVALFLRLHVFIFAWGVVKFTAVYTRWENIALTLSFSFKSLHSIGPLRKGAARTPKRRAGRPRGWSRVVVVQTTATLKAGASEK